MKPLKKLMLGAPVAAALLLAAPAAKAQSLGCYDEIFSNYAPNQCYCAGPYTNGGSLTDCFSEVDEYGYSVCNTSGGCCGDSCSWI